MKPIRYDEMFFNPEIQGLILVKPRNRAGET